MEADFTSALNAGKFNGCSVSVATIGYNVVRGWGMKQKMKCYFMVFN